MESSKTFSEVSPSKWSYLLLGLPGEEPEPEAECKVVVVLVARPQLEEPQGHRHTATSAKVAWPEIFKSFFLILLSDISILRILVRYCVN